LVRLTPYQLKASILGAADGIDYALWDLRAAWAVEKDSRIAI